LTIQLTAEQARRFLVARHGLAPPRALSERPESVLTAIERLGVLQFDPLEVPGARNHDLVLHARIRGYQREWCDRWLYGPDRRLFEIYNKSLNIVPMAELPHYRLTWARNAERYTDRPEATATHGSDRILSAHADVAADILATLESEGPRSTAAFAHHAHAIDWWWAPTRAARAVLEALFVSGRVGIARREGNRRYYDLIDRLVPADLLARAESEEDAQRHRLLSRFRAVGLASPSAQAEVVYGTGTAAERLRRTAELVASGQLVEVRVEGLKGARYVISQELPLLEAARAGERTDSPGVAFIAPLDPLMWDRRLVRQLFEFDYVWEVYVPEHRRRWGYYVLPILFGDRLVGRIEPRLDRATRTLRILGIWWEAGFDPRRASGLVPAMRAALLAYAGFVGARSVEWAPATGGSRRLFGSIMKRAGGQR
jgi:uncharacterized protein YcaQ